MAMQSKILKGAKAIGKALTESNTIADGGLSAILIPRRFTGPAALGIIGGMGAIGVANEGIKSRNRAIMGRVSYGGGMARMTSSYTSGIIPAMQRASGGNYAAFSDMAEEVVKGSGIGGSLETYGATPELVSALYHMGGR